MSRRLQTCLSLRQYPARHDDPEIYGSFHSKPWQTNLPSLRSVHLADLRFSLDQTANAALFWLLLGVSVAVARGLAAAAPEQG